MTPDEIYELAQRASRAAPVAPAGVAASSTPGGWSTDAGPVESFRWIVDRVTEVLASTVRLPSFDEWVAEYRSDPARYEEELLGFWKEIQ